MYINPFVREARGDCGRFFLCLAEQNRELLNCRHRYVPAVVPGKERLRNTGSASGMGRAKRVLYLALEI